MAPRFPCSGFALAVLLSMVAWPQAALAVWSGDPAVNLPVCAAAGYQGSPVVVSDGSGGAIVVWMDERSGDWVIYAQRLNRHGVVQWAGDGVPVCVATNDQDLPVAAPDGAGGVIVAWQDPRGVSADIYAQHIGPDGVSQWATDGIPVGVAAGEQLTPAITSDGVGGAIVAWVDRRTGAAGQIAAQRVLGGVPLWTANGVLLHTYVAGNKSPPSLTTDESGGAIVAWHHAGDNSVRVRHVTSVGGVGWTADGVQLCTTASADRGAPRLVPDRTGGAIVAWSDSRSPVYAQRVNSSGVIQWAANGLSLGATAAAWLDAAPDGAGGALVAWPTSSSVRVQRVNGAGTMLWDSDGVRFVSLAGVQPYVSLAAASGGGALVGWVRSGVVCAQGVSPQGVILWAPTSAGVTVSTGIDLREAAVVTTDGTGGAILAFESPRNLDIRAQRVERTGELPHPQSVITSVLDVAGDQGGQVRVE